MFRRVLSVLNNQVILYGAQAAFTILCARLLGPTARGVFVVCVVFAAFVELFAEFGLSDATTYQISRNEENSGRMLAVAAVCIPVQLCLIAAIYGFFTTHYSLSPFHGASVGAIGASLILSCATLLQRFTLGGLSGLQAFKERNIVCGLPPVGTLGAVIGTLVFHHRATVGLLLGANVGAVTLSAALGGWYLFRRCRRSSVERLSGREIRAVLAYGAKSWVTSMVQNLNYRLDALILNVLMGKATVGLYSAGVSAAECLLLIPTAVSLVLFPAVASIDADRQKSVTPVVLGTTLYATSTAAVAMAIAVPWLIPALFGHAYRDAVASTWLLLPGMLGMATAKIIGSALSGMGRPECTTYSVATGLVCTVALDWILIPRAGICGAACASSIAYWVTAVGTIYHYRRLTRQPMNLFVHQVFAGPVNRIRGGRNATAT